MIGMLIFGGCNDEIPPVQAAISMGAIPQTRVPDKLGIWMTVGDRRFAMTLVDSKISRAFVSRLPLTLEMSELNGNEKHGVLPTPLPTNARRAGTIHDGDVMLYGSDTLVVFYKTLQSEYSYTPLGRLDDPSDLGRALGGRSVRITFSAQ